MAHWGSSMQEEIKDERRRDDDGEYYQPVGPQEMIAAGYTYSPEAFIRPENSQSNYDLQVRILLNAGFTDDQVDAIIACIELSKEALAPQSE